MTELESSLLQLLNQKLSFNIKHLFCETNFGFTNATHLNHKSGGLLSLATSYSGIECLILESGTVSNTYLLIESILHDRPRSLLPSVNSFYRHENKIKDINISSLIELKFNNFLPFSKMVKMLLPPISFKNDHNEIFMEYVNLNYYSNSESYYGFVLYRLKKSLKRDYFVKVKREKIRDSASTFCDLEKRVANIDNLDRM